MSVKGRLAAFDHIIAGSRALLAVVPENRLDWKPHARSWTLRLLDVPVPQSFGPTADFQDM